MLEENTESHLDGEEKQYEYSGDYCRQERAFVKSLETPTGILRPRNESRRSRESGYNWKDSRKPKQRKTREEVP